MTATATKLDIITAPAAVREHLAGENREVVEYAAVYAYYHYDSWASGPRGKAPLEIDREEWRLRYAVSQYETAVARAREAASSADAAESLARSDPPNGYWDRCYLTPAQSERVGKGEATLKGHGLVRFSERWNEYQRWITYTAERRAEIVAGRKVDATERRQAADRAAKHAESLLTPEVAAWIDERDNRLSAIRRRVEALRRLCVQMSDDSKHRSYCDKCAASYAREFGTSDRAQWSEYIRGWMASIESRLLTGERRQQLRAEAKQVFSEIRKMGAASHVRNDVYLGSSKRRKMFIGDETAEGDE